MNKIDNVYSKEDIRKKLNKVRGSNICFNQGY